MFSLPRYYITESENVYKHINQLKAQGNKTISYVALKKQESNFQTI